MRLLLCALFLFAIVQGQEFDRAKLKNYYKCWNHMNCVSGPLNDHLEKCLSQLEPGDLELYVKYLNDNVYKFQDPTVPGAISEYCKKDGGSQHNLYNKLVIGYKTFEKAVCGDPDWKDMCSRAEKLIDCLYLYMQQHFPNDDCKTN